MSDVDSLIVQKHIETKTVVLKLSGRLVSHALPGLAPHFDELDPEAIDGLSLDLEGVTRIDSRGVGALVGWHRHFTANGRVLRILNVQPPVMKVFRVLNLQSLFDLGPEPENPLAAKRAHQLALRQSHEYVRQILTALGEGIVCLDDSGLVVFVNASAERLLGVVEAETIELHFKELFRRLDPVREPNEDEKNPFSADELDLREPWRGEYHVRGATSNSAICTFIMITATPILVATKPAGTVLGLVDITSRKQAEIARELALAELREAAEHINTLHGLIPICASCKKVRDDRGYWNQIETYLAVHSEAEFSHGICPDCRVILYPELEELQQEEA